MEFLEHLRGAFRRPSLCLSVPRPLRPEMPTGPRRQQGRPCLGARPLTRRPPQQDRVSADAVGTGWGDVGCRRAWTGPGQPAPLDRGAQRRQHHSDQIPSQGRPAGLSLDFTHRGQASGFGPTLLPTHPPRRPGPVPEGTLPGGHVPWRACSVEGTLPGGHVPHWVFSCSVHVSGLPSDKTVAAL